MIPHEAEGAQNRRHVIEKASLILLLQRTRPYALASREMPRRRCRPHIRPLSDKPLSSNLKLSMLAVKKELSFFVLPPNNPQIHDQYPDHEANDTIALSDR